MSLFGYIYDKNAKFSSESAMIFESQCIKKVTDFIDEKIKAHKPQWSRGASDYHSCSTSMQNSDSPDQGIAFAEEPQTEQVKRFDLSPKNPDIVKYCKCLINAKFQGQCDESDGEDLIPPTVVPGNMKLSNALKAIDELLRTVDQDFSGEEEEFHFYLQACIEARLTNKVNERSVRRKFYLDAKKFVQIYKQRNTLSEELSHDEYWASRQQLLSGKVVADWIDPEYGPLDPIFGVLLNPTLGRTGPGDSGWVHKILFDDSGPMAYHSAVHDAYGYLITHHDVGPGYDYLGAWSLFESTTCMSGQLSGIKFWRDVLKDCTEVEEKLI